MSKRRQEEKAEGLTTITNQAPAEKFQTEQQVAKSTPIETSAGSSSFVPERKKLKGSQLKQEVAAMTVKDASYGGSNAGDGLNFAGRNVSGTQGGILGAANATPVAGHPSRGNSRVDKKLDRNTTKLNYIPNDQVIVEYDESAPLADAANTDQGFNGTYRNEFARSQKKAGNVPGELMFDRSLDLIDKDMIYFGQGQIVSQTGVQYDDAPSRTAVKNAVGQYINSDEVNYAGAAPGNYITRSAELGVDALGKTKYLVFNEENLNCTVDGETANRSSSARLRLMNDAELVRQTMDSKAGDEKADIWTPLARAVSQPTQIVGYLRDIEAMTGNELFLAYRKATSSFSYQLNRAHKDGQDAVGPAIEALCGLKYGPVSKEYFLNTVGNSLKDCFTTEHYVNGDASLMIALYDSISKYNNKADALVQPRGLRMHLQTADNNLDTFKVDKLFAQAFDASECFSTIDREYDPMSPVLMTDKAVQIHKCSWNANGAFIKDSYYAKVAPANDQSKTEVSEVLIPSGFINDLAEKAYYIHILSDKEAVASVTIDEMGGITLGSSFESRGLAVLLSTASTSLADDNHVDNFFPVLNTYIDVRFKNRVYDITIDAKAEDIYFGHLSGPFRYMYSDLRNSYVVTVSNPLIQGFVDYIDNGIGGKLFSLIHGNTLNIATIHSTKYFSLWSFMLCAATPFINKARINAMRDVLYYETNVEYPFSSTLISMKDVSTKSYANFGYSDYDHELVVSTMGHAAKLKWRMPELIQKIGSIDRSSSTYDSLLLPWYVNQNEIYVERNTVVFDHSAADMSMPSIRSGVRLASLDDMYSMSERDIRLAYDMVASWENFSNAVTYEATGVYKYSTVTDGQVYLGCKRGSHSVFSFLSLPRQLGFVIDAPYGVLTPDYHRYDYTTSLHTLSVVGTSSHRATYWLAPGAVSFTAGSDEAILDNGAVNINRAQNFSQTWYCILASGTAPTVDHGMILSLNHLLNNDDATPVVGRMAFHPFKRNDINTPVTEGMVNMLSLQKAMWTRIQKLPYVISPFDTVAYVHQGSMYFDPYDMLYYFGLAGFRASDFRESIYNREKEVVNQGMLFVSDPWIEDSLLFREGSASSGITTTKGFEI